MVYRFIDAKEESAGGGKRVVHSRKGTLHDSSGSHESCQINTHTDSNTHGPQSVDTKAHRNAHL